MTKPKNIFNGKPIRAQFSTEHSEWMFSAVDVVAAIVNPAIPRNYWSDLKRALVQEGNQLHEKIVQLKIVSPADGKGYKTDCFNKEWTLALVRRLKANIDYDAFVEWINQFEGENRKFILKHKDIDVIELELDESGSISMLGKLLNAEHLPIGTAGANGADFSAVKKWWGGRSIPASRDGLKEFLESVGMNFPQELLNKSFGLSLSDQYWICPKDTEITWASINFFHNPFSEDVGNLLFSKMEAFDENAISFHSPDNTSDGVLKKKWKIIDGKRCLIKAGSGASKQEVANEVLASNICKRLGIPHVTYEVIDVDGEQYSVCEDFITGDTELVTMAHILNLIPKDNNVSEYERLVLKCEDFGIKDARQKIDMMLVLDYIIVNTDRHYNNFGLVRDANTLKWLSVAPIFDTGTSMWCKDISEDILPESIDLPSRPFRKKHAKQIEFVKNFFWLNLDALDGIEDEYLKIIKATVADYSVFEARALKLRSALRQRIELLRGIVNRK